MGSDGPQQSNEAGPRYGLGPVFLWFDTRRSGSAGQIAHPTDHAFQVIGADSDIVDAPALARRRALGQQAVGHPVSQAAELSCRRLHAAQFLALGLASAGV